MKHPILLQEWSQLQIILVFSTFTFTFLFFKLFRHKAASNSLPSPLKLPLIGNLHQLGSLPHQSMQALSEKYGPLMLLHFGCVPIVIVSSEEIAREVMKTHDLNFASRPPSSMAKRLLYDANPALAPYGEYWRQVRRICVLHLLSIKKVQSFRSIRKEEVSLLVEKIRASRLRPVNLSESMIALTNHIICRVALGRKYYEEEGGGNRVREMLHEFGALLASFPKRDFIPLLAWMDRLSGLDARVRRNFKEIDGFLESVLEEHLRDKMNAGKDHDKELTNFFDVLLSLDEKDDNDVALSLSRDNIKAIILDMFAAGTDTTFAVLEWTMAELMKNPKVMKRAQEEVRNVIGDKREFVEEDTEKMNYLKAVIKEALRLHPPIPLLVPRQTMEEIELKGYEIPVGRRVIINAWAIGRDPKSWDNPEKFFPERFMNSDVDFRGQDFRLIPFGAGRRGCPGISLAVATIEVTLANFLYHFDWELPNGMASEALDMSESPGTTVNRKSSLILVAKPRVPQVTSGLY